MEIRAGYKRTEVGVIPEGWDVFEMGRIGDTLIGLTYSPSNVKEFGTLVLRSSNIQDGKLSFKNNVFVDMPLSDRVIVREKDILICVRNGSRQLIGKCALIDSNTAGSAFGAFMSIFRSKFNDILFFQFQSTSTKRQIEQILGATINQITNKDLNGFKVALPSSEDEQEAIAGALSDVNELILSLETLITKKRHIKQGATQELLTGQKRLAGFSGDWEIITIREFADCITGGTPSTLQSSYWNGNIPWMSSGELNLKRVYDVNRRITKEGLSNSSAHMIPPHCVLIGLAGQGKTRGTVAMNFIGLCTNQSIAAILPNRHFSDEYLYHNLDYRYSELRELSSGGGRGGLNLSLIKSIEIPFPEKQEQVAIANILSDMDSEIATLEGKLTKTRQIKQGMMFELLTGQIRLVVSQSVEDEIIVQERPSQNWAFKEAVIIASLTDQFGSAKFPLGRKRCTKLTYLMHRKAKLNTDGYLKKAAGPYNPNVRYSGPEALAQKKKYVCSHKSGKFSGFVAGDNIGEAKSYFSKWYGQDMSDWLNQFRYKKNDDLEMLATVDMAMVEVCKSGEAATLETVKHYIVNEPEWAAKLEREAFCDSNIINAIQICTKLFGDTASTKA